MSLKSIQVGQEFCISSIGLVDFHFSSVNRKRARVMESGKKQMTVSVIIESTWRLTIQRYAMGKRAPYKHLMDAVAEKFKLDLKDWEFVGPGGLCLETYDTAHLLEFADCHDILLKPLNDERSCEEAYEKRRIKLSTEWETK
nr:uncharacterized protein LOC108054350 [Drosophila takahashii]